MMTGGYGSDNLDSTETLDTDAGILVTSGSKLPTRASWTASKEAVNDERECGSVKAEVEAKDQH